MKRLQLVRVAAALLVALTATVASAQETEPNDTCATAQVLEFDVLPFEFAGQLGVNEPDIDFFVVFSAPPGEVVQFDLQGLASGAGTLGDPFMGVFDADDCIVRNSDDDSGVGSDSQLVIVMPASGRIVVGATQFPDFNFLDGGFGSYVLRVTRLGPIGAIDAQLVDAETAATLPGDADPFASAVLFRCAGENCFEIVGFQQADGAGQVRFVTDFFGNPLTAGAYLIQARADGYDQAIAGPFTVAEGEDFDVGPIGLPRLQLIGSVSGRIVDAIAGAPLSGVADPFARVQLERCLDPTFCFVAAFVFADELGQFSIDARPFGLPPGDYRATAMADNYNPTTTEIVTIGDRETFDFGAIALAPFPVRLANVVPCELPPSGGTCSFGAEVINVGPGNFRGKAWANIDYFGSQGFTRFQVGRKGSRNPRPVAVHLPEGRSADVRFELTLPATVPAGAFACGTIWLGRSPSPEFDLVAQQFAFCVSKTEAGVRAMNPIAARKMLREARSASAEAESAPRGFRNR